MPITRNRLVGSFHVIVSASYKYTTTIDKYPNKANLNEVNISTQENGGTIQRENEEYGKIQMVNAAWWMRWPSG